MNDWRPTDVAMIITTIFTGVCAVIAAYGATKTKNATKEISNELEKKSNLVVEKAEQNAEKLNTIHTLTNGNLSKTQEELEMERRKNDYLEKLVIELTDNHEPGQLDKAKKKVEDKQAKIGKRRKTDLTREEDAK